MSRLVLLLPLLAACHPPNVPATLSVTPNLACAGTTANISWTTDPLATTTVRYRLGPGSADYLPDMLSSSSPASLLLPAWPEAYWVAVRLTATRDGYAQTVLDGEIFVRADEAVDTTPHYLVAGGFTDCAGAAITASSAVGDGDFQFARPLRDVDPRMHVTTVWHRGAGFIDPPEGARGVVTVEHDGSTPAMLVEGDTGAGTGVFSGHALSGIWSLRSPLETDERCDPGSDVRFHRPPYEMKVLIGTTCR
jgi:hypothetical protein